MRRLMTTALAALALAAASGAPQVTAAQALPPGAKPPPPTPALDVETFRFLLGRWRGRGTFMNGAPVASTLTFSVASDKAIEVRFAEDAPNTYAYVGVWGREPGSRRLLMLMANSLDGPALFRSEGWRGDRLVFEPDPGVKPAPGAPRFTYVKTGPDSFDLTYEFSINGAWFVGDKQSFTRQR